MLRISVDPDNRHRNSFGERFWIHYLPYISYEFAIIEAPDELGKFSMGHALGCYHMFSLTPRCDDRRPLDLNKFRTRYSFDVHCDLPMFTDGLNSRIPTSQ